MINQYNEWTLEEMLKERDRLHKELGIIQRAIWNRRQADAIAESIEQS